ncbi:M64 family metallopeptidase [Actinomadura sp. DC4]|uniref:M64 family metallopeptidase n=1 Tax=Actinomadura sp. DC4 TaxID=3055069 RepID=UPI0025B1191C|nr:M64 family metallopeptidase [Actinomadura sp. DC4]MDN3358540.1 M64 family metallopeptidase [Actinomadura sp. DC4]
MLRRMVAAVVATMAIGASPVLVAPAAVAHADVAGGATVVPVQVTGDPAKRFNVVILGDGYAETDMPKFRENVDKEISTLFAFEPWKSYRSYINVYRVEITSGESGVSCDPSLTSPERTTPLSMRFWSGCRADGIQRLLVMDNDAANGYANMVTGTTAANRQIVALANSTTYGGAGGTYATASGGNALSSLIMPHEIGHSLGGLQDEYNYYQRGVPGGAYTGGEPDSIHHTLLTEEQMRQQHAKWWRWLGDKSTAGGVIGRYEGGMYDTTGVWRPSAHSMMKSLGYAYDQVERERMTQAISGKLHLIQDGTPTGAPIGADRVAWIETLHPVSHTLRATWTLDGRTVPGSTDRHNVDLARQHLRPGTHTLTVTVQDPTGFVRDPAIRASAALTQTLTWTVDTRVKTPSAAAAPGFTDSTPTGNAVGADDVVYAETTHPATSVPAVRWTLDGRRVSSTDNDRDLALGRFHLTAGTHKVTARAVNPATGAASPPLTWTVDAQRPAVSAVFSRPAATNGRTKVFDDHFTMKLSPTDDSSGATLAEFQVDGDGWYRYFGWPTDSTAPFLFTPLGTNIDDLFYGKLGKPARAVAWENVPPGYGRHTIEYRAIDSAGNVGRTTTVDVVLRKTG